MLVWYANIDICLTMTTANPLILKVTPPPNRETRRAVVAEYKKLLGLLADVELSFYNQLFKSPFSYWYVYTMHLDVWNSAVELIKKHEKPKYWGVDEHYFEKNFKPIENVEEK